MMLSRITAFATALIIIAVLTLAGITLTLHAGCLFTQSSGVAMEGGFIKKFDAPDSFDFVTDKGEVEHFICTDRCIAAQPHMQRHINEHAHTNIYYKQAPNGSLYAIDVD